MTFAALVDTINPPAIGTLLHTVATASRSNDYTGATATVAVLVSDRASTRPTITLQPASQTILTGQRATMNVSATGTNPLSYQWYLGGSPGTTNPIGGATWSSYATPALTSATSYWVRVSNLGGFTNSNTATISISRPFSDAVLTAGTGVTRAVHIAELRTRVDALRAWYGLEPYPYTDGTLTIGTTFTNAQHIVDVRSALSQVYLAAGRTLPVYTAPVLTAGTPTKAVHVSQSRAAVIAIE